MADFGLYRTPPTGVPTGSTMIESSWVPLPEDVAIWNAHATFTHVERTRSVTLTNAWTAQPGVSTAWLAYYKAHLTSRPQTPGGEAGAVPTKGQIWPRRG